MVDSIKRGIFNEVRICFALVLIIIKKVTWHCINSPLILINPLFEDRLCNVLKVFRVQYLSMVTRALNNFRVVIRVQTQDSAGGNKSNEVSIHKKKKNRKKIREVGLTVRYVGKRICCCCCCRFVIKSQMSAGEKFVGYNGKLFADLLLQ